MAQTTYTNIAGGINRAPFGGVTLIIEGVAYRAMGYNPEQGSRRIERKDTFGDSAEVMLRAEPRAQTGITLQLATKLTPLPRLFAEFVDPLDNITVMVVSKVGESRPEGEFWVCSIDASANTP